MTQGVVDYLEAGWKQINCHCSNGIQWGGTDPVECDMCEGKGYLWRSPMGRVASYPGGPFRGSLALKGVTRAEAVAAITAHHGLMFNPPSRAVLARKTT